MARRREPDVLLEVVPHRVLHRQAPVFVVADHPVIDPPQVRGCHLTEVADDDLERRETIEHPVDTHAENVPLYVLAELQRRHHQPFSVVPDLFLDVRNLV